VSDREIEILQGMRETLEQCAAPFLARGDQMLTVEFQRRMDIAHKALSDLDAFLAKVA